MQTAHPLHDEVPLGAVRPLELCLRLSHAQAVISRRLDNTLSSLHGLSFGDFTILHHLSRAPAHRLRRVDLAERLGLTASGVTRTLLPLEKLGLVTREPDARDARVAYAAVTDAGLRLFEHASLTAAQVSEELAQGTPTAQIGQLATLLARLGGAYPSDR